jgi:hypothetical protein
MKRLLAASCTCLTLIAFDASAQTADELVARYIRAIGGQATIDAVTSFRASGKYYGGGGFEMLYVQENKRPDKVREENTFQGLTGITAYDGVMGWKIDPWGGKKDPESLEEEELKSIIEDSDFDGPLVNYRQKGNMVEYVGMDAVEGTDAYKLRITMKNGDKEYYYLDVETAMPIKIEIQRLVRGSEKDYEFFPAEYKLVNGWYFPFSLESNARGSQARGKIAYREIRANIPLDDSCFVKPAAPASR